MTTAAEMVAKAKSKIHEVTPQDVASKLGKVLIVDVREPEEYAAGHIPGAINIPRGVLEFRINQYPDLQDRDREIVMQCQGGGRSALATVAMQDLGFKHVVNLAGGFGAWNAAGLPTER
ncbi:MAG TPA: rhodanese-like domain-containing protein [Gammaproteobacteria bacterium]|nr:rhodanese-like domain-containing protein [Gammaproteobacteria bacterium]